MNKESLFTLKLEPELHAQFMAAAKASHRPASQVVRELMREYVNKHNQSEAYEVFLQAKVAAARRSVQAGIGIDNDEVEATFAQRRRLANKE